MLKLSFDIVDLLPIRPSRFIVVALGVAVASPASSQTLQGHGLATYDLQDQWVAEQFTAKVEATEGCELEVPEEPGSYTAYTDYQLDKLQEIWEDLGSAVEVDAAGGTAMFSFGYISPQTLAHSLSGGLIHSLASGRFNAALSQADKSILRPFFILSTACGKFLIQVKAMCGVQSVRFVSDPYSVYEFKRPYTNWWQALGFSLDDWLLQKIEKIKVPSLISDPRIDFNLPGPREETVLVGEVINVFPASYPTSTIQSLVVDKRHEDRLAFSATMLELPVHLAEVLPGGTAAKYLAAKGWYLTHSILGATEKAASYNEEAPGLADLTVGSALDLFAVSGFVRKYRKLSRTIWASAAAGITAHGMYQLYQRNYKVSAADAVRMVILNIGFWHARRTLRVPDTVDDVIGKIDKPVVDESLQRVINDLEPALTKALKEAPPQKMRTILEEAYAKYGTFLFTPLERLKTIKDVRQVWKVLGLGEEQIRQRAELLVKFDDEVKGLWTSADFTKAEVIAKHGPRLAEFTRTAFTRATELFVMHPPLLVKRSDLERVMVDTVARISDSQGRGETFLRLIGEQVRDALWRMYSESNAVTAFAVGNRHIQLTPMLPEQALTPENLQFWGEALLKHLDGRGVELAAVLDVTRTAIHQRNVAALAEEAFHGLGFMSLAGVGYPSRPFYTISEKFGDGVAEYYRYVPQLYETERYARWLQGLRKDDFNTIVTSLPGFENFRANWETIEQWKLSDIIQYFQTHLPEVDVYFWMRENGIDLAQKQVQENYLERALADYFARHGGASQY